MPPSPPIAPPNAADRDTIEALCDEGETRLKQGAPFELVELVRRCPTRLQDRLAPELLFLEIDYARRSGGCPRREEFLTRYPGYGRHVEAAFCTLDPDEGGIEEARRRFAALQPGATLSHYQIEQRIGQGAAAEVWKASDTMTGRRVALKIPRWADHSIDQRLRFLREGRVLSRLDHPGIVGLYEMGHDGVLPYLAIEYVDGGALRDALRAGPLPPTRAAELCRSLAEALDHAHQKGVLHRDIKPGNILLRYDGEPVLTDLGLAKDGAESGDLTEHGDILGTIAYMAPEQAAGRSAEADERSDIYGVGAVLYESLTGRQPALPNAGSRAGNLTGIGLDARRLQPAAPSDLAAICLKATQTLPADRYATAADLAADLRRYLEGQTVQARHPSRWALGLRRAVESRWTATAAIITASAVVLANVMGPAPGDAALRDVQVLVDPPTARVAFVPLGDRGDSPDPRQAVFGRGEGRIQARLAPGPYLVVAVTPDGGFHEVYRVVRAIDNVIGSPGKYRTNAALPTGGVRLPPIQVPSAEVSGDMVYVDGTPGYAPGGAEGATGRFAIPAYYMDVIEHRNDDGGAWTGSYFMAIDIAERLGKRLPTELEYEFAATARGASRFPWGDAFPDADTTFEGNVAAIDRLDLEGVIRGLCSGVAEWTMPAEGLNPARPLDFAVVRGGDGGTIEGDLRFTEASRDPTNRSELPDVIGKRGIGFRCVRSAAPLFRYDEIR